jgi:ParB-like chromosome segregation protein Spo0J
MMFVWIARNKPTPVKLWVSDLSKHLEYQSWEDRDGVKYSAIDVIHEPEKYVEDMERILRADMQYPIIADSNGDIVDGMHRLTKAHIEGQETIDAYIFDCELMEKFRLGTQNEYERVRHMYVHEIIELYLERFID